MAGALNKACFHKIPSDPRTNSGRIIYFGSFFRKSDRAIVPRYRCLHCGRTFSSATFDLCFNQKKRHKNAEIYASLMSCVSQRRTAMNTSVSKQTVSRKIIFMGSWARGKLLQLLERYPPSRIVEFDEMETFEHSKCKPLSIHFMVESKSRRSFGFAVSSQPAKGRLAPIAIKKYGPREDGRKAARLWLFDRVRPHVAVDAVIKSDKNPYYVTDVRNRFPKATHQRHKGRRGCVVGQGELKRGRHDPLFTLNHTAAMVRDNLKRMSRKTWCTTKKAEHLAHLLDMYAIYHNEFLLKRKKHPKISQFDALLSA